MHVGLAIFVKTPGRSPLKTRLAADIGRDAAHRFHLLAANAVAAVARQTQQAHADCVPHWAVAEPDALDDPLWASLPRIDQGDGDLGARMGRVTDKLCAEHGAAVLLGADTPQIRLQDIVSAMRGLQTHAFVIGPSEDGGFWLFATRGDVPQTAWATTPWSQPDTAVRFCNALGEAPIAHLRSLRDADTAQDLPPLLATLDALPESLPEQTRLADWLRTLDM